MFIFVGYYYFHTIQGIKNLMHIYSNLNFHEWDRVGIPVQIPVSGLCNQTLLDNEEILGGFMFFVYVVIGHGILLTLTMYLGHRLLCDSSQNIHDCAVAGIIQVFFYFEVVLQIFYRNSQTFQILDS